MELNTQILKLLDSSAQLLSLLGSWFIAWYGFKRFWPDFKRQKRAENLIANAKETLRITMELEQAIIKLRVALNGPHQAHTKGARTTKSEQTDAHLEVLCKLNALRNMLLLLRNESDLVDVHERNIIVTWSNRLNSMLERQYPRTPDELVSLEWLEEKEFVQHAAWRSGELESFKRMLLNLHEIHTVHKPSIIGSAHDFFKYGVVVACFLGVVIFTIFAMGHIAFIVKR